jgi:predicted transcriptional regulator
MGLPREGKPYCSLHVLDHPYIRSLAAEIAARESEIAAIEAGNVVDVHSGLAREVLALIRETGGATVERVARERGVSHAVSHAVIIALAGVGLIVTRQTTRGAIMAQSR